MKVRFTLYYKETPVIGEEVEYGPSPSGKEPNRNDPMFIKALLDYQDTMIRRFIFVKMEEVTDENHGL